MSIQYLVLLTSGCFLFGAVAGLLLKRGINGSQFLRDMFSGATTVSWGRFHASLVVVWGLVMNTILILRNTTITELPSLAGLLAFSGGLYGISKGLDVANNITKKGE